MAIINRGLSNNTLKVLEIIDRNAKSSPKVSELFKKYSEAKNGISKNKSYKNLVLISIVYLSVKNSYVCADLLALWDINGDSANRIILDIKTKVQNLKDVKEESEDPSSQRGLSQRDLIMIAIANQTSSNCIFSNHKYRYYK
ncbi:MAG: hypothetical protein RsTaC01_1011 [Candidatus Paraimprobicoccus trichonymphae]|uniref:Uncharacterized protein n=1 Tax=Candidatus Paraimprobicoccus trichonymphae TaxID=3033793 RepID=A0AA48HX19_9FIRM|nr:MAG: hypothetical protein RsTaC01_0890 [Candidatus Paraimprobicoccus trichonymphae]BED93055.1 MAG: hypothetical protein RsTaC01_1011 [Candidatus Paraimprobicoccus trichonymphae]